MILVIDNYDSFTYNLVHYLSELGARMIVRRNDALSADEALAMQPEAIPAFPRALHADRGRRLPGHPGERAGRPCPSSASASATRRSPRPSAAR